MIHLGMSGSLRVVDEMLAPDKHDHVDVVLDSGKALRLHDPRRFGAVLWTTENTDGVDAAHLSISNKGLANSATEGEAEVIATCGDDSTSVAVVIEAPITIESVKINDGREYTRIANRSLYGWARYWNY